MYADVNSAETFAPIRGTRGEQRGRHWVRAEDIGKNYPSFSNFCGLPVKSARDLTTILVFEAKIFQFWIILLKVFKNCMGPISLNILLWVTEHITLCKKIRGLWVRL